MGIVHHARHHEFFSLLLYSSCRPIVFNVLKTLENVHLLMNFSVM